MFDSKNYKVGLGIFYSALPPCPYVHILPVPRVVVMACVD